MKISTSKLAQKHDLEPKEMFSKLEKLGFIKQNGTERKLTDEGMKRGGDYFENTTYGTTYIVWPEDIDLTSSNDPSTTSKEQNNEKQEVVAWKDILTKEKIEKLYPMHHRPNKSHKYSIFIISDSSKYKDIDQGKNIEYLGTDGEEWINKKFYDLAQQFKSKKEEAERIKVYFKKGDNEWTCKGVYILIDSTKTNGKYKFILQKSKS